MAQNATAVGRKTPTEVKCDKRSRRRRALFTALAVTCDSGRPSVLLTVHVCTNDWTPGDDGGCRQVLSTSMNDCRLLITVLCTARWSIGREAASRSSSASVDVLVLLFTAICSICMLRICYTSMTTVRPSVTLMDCDHIVQQKWKWAHYWKHATCIRKPTQIVITYDSMKV